MSKGKAMHLNSNYPTEFYVSDVGYLVIKQDCFECGRNTQFLLTPEQTKVVYKETHDKLALTTTFPSGGSLKFSVSRGGEKLMVGFSNDPVICKQQLACVAKWVKLSESESNGQRML